MGTFSAKFKIYFFNNLITASVMVENHVVLHEIQQLGYLNSNLVLRWDSPFNLCTAGGRISTPSGFSQIAKNGGA